MKAPTLLITLVLAVLSAACSKLDDPLAQVNATLQSASRIQVVTPARPGLFLSSKVAMPSGKDVGIIEKSGQQEFVIVYGADTKADAVIIPLTADKFQVLNDPTSIATYESKLKALQEPPHEASDSNGSGFGGSAGGGGHSAGGIKVGMTKAQVRAKLGAPDRIDNFGGLESWYYEPLNPASDLAHEGILDGAAAMPFGGVFGMNVGRKITPKKKSYQIYFSGDQVSNVVVSSS